MTKAVRMFLRFAQGKGYQVLRIPLRSIWFGHVETIEVGLGTRLHAAEVLEISLWICRREPERHAIVHNRFAESETEHAHSILCLLGSNRVEVERSGHPGKVRIPEVSV